MNISTTPNKELKKKALGLLEKIEGHPRALNFREYSGNLMVKRSSRVKSLGCQNGCQIKQLSSILPVIVSKKVCESFRSQNEGSFVFKNKAGDLVVPRLNIEKSLEYKDFFQNRKEEHMLEDKVKSLKSRCKVLSFNLTPSLSRKLKQKLKTPSLIDRQCSQKYEQMPLSPIQNSLLQKWNEKFNTNQSLHP